MTWTPSDKEIEAVLRLPGPKRYSHFIKRVADMERLWGLWDEGWAMTADDQGRQLLPVWPHERYAALWAVGEWAAYVPKPIELKEWLERWIPGLEKDRILVAVFPTPDGKGVPVEPRRMENDLREELLWYE